MFNCWVAVSFTKTFTIVDNGSDDYVTSVKTKCTLRCKKSVNPETLADDQNCSFAGEL